MAEHTIVRRSRTKTLAALLLGVLAVIGVSMVLPFTGLLLVEQGVAQEQDAAAAAAEAERVAAMEDAELNRAFWKEARRGESGYTTVRGIDTGVLIQTEGEVWRELREGPVIVWGGWALVAVLAILLLFHLISGPARLEKGRSGVRITRWTLFERIMHWYVAILFIILTITGLSLLLGRNLLIPLIGHQAFGAWAAFAKPVHDYLSLFFVAGLVLLLLPWLGQNIPRGHDWTWFKMGGGYVGDKHPPAGFVNAGEKVWYWILFFGAIVLTVSGFFLLFPNFGWDRGEMQWAHLFHSVSGLALIAFAFGHVYLGTAGNEGSFEGMWTGEVDANWAEQHHNLWYEDVRRHGDRSDVRPTQSTPAH